MDFLEKVKKELTPDEPVRKEIDSFIHTLNDALKKNKIRAVCVAGGSVAKNTFLKGDFDVDLFVKFDYSYKEKNISDILETVLKKYKCERVHGSRDYFQLKEKFNYEIVPVLDVKDPAKALNVTDMSPMHVVWVKKNLKKGQEGEIRLSKKFCKANEVYGAESYINGFSGHVLDILIIHYGSFLNLLKESQKWKSPLVIDTEKYYKNSRDILFSLNQSKISGPMILIDPLLKTRNAASALSYEKFALFKKRAALFIKKPSEKFFVEQEIGKTYLKSKYKKNLFILTLEAENGKRDVIGGKILKAFTFMRLDLQKAGFKLKYAGWHWNKKNHCLFWFVFDNLILPEKIIVEGPPVEMKEFAADFKKVHKKTFEKKGKLFAEVTIEKRKAEENIKEIAAKEYFQEKIKLVKTEKVN